MRNFKQINAFMWCNRCQQDVPAVAMVGDSSVVCCAACGAALRGSETSEPLVHDEKRAAFEQSLDELADTLSVERDMPRHVDEFELDDDLHEAERLVRRVHQQAGQPQRAAVAPVAPPANAPVEEAAPLPTSQRRRKKRGRPRDGGSHSGWLLTGLGLSGLVCGSALLVWSVVSRQPQHWNTGLPIALISQAVLACGLVMQLGAGKTNRRESRDEDEPREAAATVTHLHVHAGSALEPSGVSVHYGSAPQSGESLATSRNRLEHEIEQALRRAA